MINLNEFTYPKKDLNDTNKNLVDYKLLQNLLNKYSRIALELALISGYILADTNTENVTINPEYEQDITQDWMELAVLTVYDQVMNQGHSRFSFSYYINILIPILRGNNVTALSGNEWEWEDISKYNDEESETLYQNFRYPSIFRVGNSPGEAYWSDGKIFTNDGEHWYTKGLESSVPVTFPLNTAELKPEKIYLESLNPLCDMEENRNE